MFSLFWLMAVDQSGNIIIFLDSLFVEPCVFKFRMATRLGIFVLAPEISKVYFVCRM